ncbi:MAG: DUF433 domain-containing protein [Nitrospirota bacterium]
MHPHITKNPDVCEGSPVITGTRFPVRSVKRGRQMPAFPE